MILHEVLKDDPPLSVDAKQEQPVHVEWRGLFKSEKSMGSLDYIAPGSSEGKVFVSPPVAAVEEGESRWNSSLVGQFLDKALPFFLVKKSVQLMWKQYGDVEVFSVENEMFIFRFADEATCDEVLESKLWYVANKPLILRKWTPGMQVLKLTMSSIPIWVKFMHLPLEYWTKTCLSHVASGVGKPLCADRVTEEQQRLGYARVLVEIDVNSVCPKEIFISRANGTNLSIGVEYPWLPPKCSGCGGFGHATYVCPNTKKENKVWMPKKIFHDKGKLASLKRQTNGKLVVQKVLAIKAFDRAISRPPTVATRMSPCSGRKSPLRVSPGSGPSKVKSRQQGRRSSNPFKVLGDSGLEKALEEEFAPRSPTTFLEVFESALSSRYKGKGVMGDQGDGGFVERGFSPTRL
jgi:hypothetical protein